MCKILYLTGGNIEDKSTRQITCDEAQKILLEAQKGKKNYNPICSMMDYRDNRLYRKIIYFTFQLVLWRLVCPALDLITESLAPCNNFCFPWSSISDLPGLVPDNNRYAL